MVLASPVLLLTPPPSSSPPKTPHRSYSVQIQSQNEGKTPPPQTVPAPTDENLTYTTMCGRFYKCVHLRARMAGTRIDAECVQYKRHQWHGKSSVS
jgi:hypothetical protein